MSSEDDQNEIAASSTITNSTNLTLSEANPEVFSAKPRPGGYLNVTNSINEIKLADSHTESDHSSKCSCSKSESTLLTFEDSDPTPSQILLEKISAKYLPKIGSQNRDCILNPKFYVLQILSTTISCILLMAREVKNIPNEHLCITKTYLSGIKDEDGEYPSNIAVILKKLADLETTVNVCDINVASSSEKRVVFPSFDNTKQKKTKIPRAIKYTRKP